MFIYAEAREDLQAWKEGDAVEKLAASNVAPSEVDRMDQST